MEHSKTSPLVLLIVRYGKSKKNELHADINILLVLHLKKHLPVR